MAEEKHIVLAPKVSFLGREETEWIRFVNLRKWLVQEGHSEYVRAEDHMVLLLERYLDALALDAEERQTALEELAEEISVRLKGVYQTIVHNPHFSPDVGRTDRTHGIETRPFLVANIEGIPGMYASLGRRLSGPFVLRLGRCRSRKGLFVAPDDAIYETCPNTDHGEEDP